MGPGRHLAPESTNPPLNLLCKGPRAMAREVAADVAGRRLIRRRGPNQEVGQFWQAITPATVAGGAPPAEAAP